MNIKELKDKGWIIFEAISGSKAYGTDLPTSDTDIRGIFVMPTKEVLKANPTSDGNYPYIPQISDATNDITYYEVGRFIELLEKGNPNILELLNVPKDCVLYKSPLFDKYFSNKEVYITKKLKYTFAGYASTQISKAKGMNKKIHNPQPELRKDLVDFCKCVVGMGSDMVSIRDYFKGSEYLLDYCGVSKLNFGKGMYRMYLDREKKYNFRGITQKKNKGVPNEIRLSSIPKSVVEDPKVDKILFYFDLDGYQVHCKQHKEYWEWVQKRNPERYKDNMKGNIGYDHKNMMHCVRLVEVAEDIVTRGTIIVRRPNRRHLLSIRMGKHKYEDLLSVVKDKVENLDSLFKKSSLPDEVDTNFTRNLLQKIRLEN